MRAPRTSLAILRMELESPLLAMANPASMTSTPRAASSWAMRSFSSWCMVTAGRLLAVAEGGVEEDDLIRRGHMDLALSIWTLS